MSKKAVVLLSGGLDSATVLAMAKDQGYACHALSFHYGQRHDGEIVCAEKISKALGATSHVVTTIDLSTWGGSALTADIDVPKDGCSEGIPITYVPARNTIFLSHALGYAEAIGALDIFIGVNAVDYSGYPDCRREFIESFEHMANLGTKIGVEGERVRIHVPLIDMTKVEIIRSGLALGIDYTMTQSCYDPQDNDPCGECDACRIRDAAFAEVN